ncbi:unnamed protein product [Bursaphelenchus okinawaensis]|uniref:Uncharacterized protein n=1 Tax=Bursaphelenchus okinawaensis TaxID=465554 RepID=A0A811LJU0_9BILA|nr:unnamed protein product [Bursaphelenchus okinawaensis]CAG9123778.1 unnamed protein product [Bursaphelenchus okinawaensis]
MKINDKLDTNLDYLAVCVFFKFGREPDISFCQDRLKKGQGFYTLKTRSLSNFQINLELIMNQVEILEMDWNDNLAVVY